MAGHEGATVTLTVGDAGPGVPEAEREAIFERFERGSASARHAGSGLGLAIGRELARRMGGDLILADTGSGSGARFVLMLPPAGGAPGAPPRRAR